MDSARFDCLTHMVSLALSRRGLAGVLGLTVIGAPGLTEAKKTKRKKKRLKRNAFGCVDVGDACRGKDANCCSGICQGKKPKKGKKDTSRCVAHDEGSCLAGQRQGLCGGDADVPCTTSADDPGLCQTTTGNAAYCTAGGGCFPCRQDTDCEPFCGAGAACVRCTACEEDEGISTACMSLINGGCEFPE